MEERGVIFRTLKSELYSRYSVQEGEERWNDMSACVRNSHVRNVGTYCVFGKSFLLLKMPYLYICKKIRYMASFNVSPVTFY